jgi:hypothetical protein
MRITAPRALLTVITAALAAAACFGDSTGLPNPGLTIITQTTGADLDPDGYVAVLVSQSDSVDHPMAINDTLYLQDATVGSYILTLTEVAANCSVADPNPRDFTVPDNGGTRTVFTILCQALPADAGDR